MLMINGHDGQIYHLGEAIFRIKTDEHPSKGYKTGNIVRLIGDTPATAGKHPKAGWRTVCRCDATQAEFCGIPVQDLEWFDENSWSYEYVSGCNGFTCKKCATWVYANGPFNCDCNALKAKPLQPPKLSLRQKRRNLLNETKNHFNLGNRSQSGGKCKYAGVGCAIGRKIKNKRLCAILDGKSDSGIATVFSKIPKSLRELGIDFLGMVQELHDDEKNWTATGLSEIGKENVNEIRAQFKL